MYDFVSTHLCTDQVITFQDVQYILSPVSYLSSAMRPCANRCNIIGQQLPTLLDVACCICFHTLLHVVACCWGVVAQSLKPVKLLATTLHIVGHSLHSQWSPVNMTSRVASHYDIKSFETS